MTPTDALLAEREKTHGSAVDVAEIYDGLTKAFTLGPTIDAPPLAWMSLDMIAMKMARILAGDPKHKDHWDDIAGYARLVSRSLEGDQ